MRAWISLATACLLSLGTALLATGAGAAEYLVSTRFDGQDASVLDPACDDGTGRCTLRAAIMQANANPGPDVVLLPLNLAVRAPYVLTIPGSGENAALTGDLDITDDLTIRVEPPRGLRQPAPLRTVDGGGLDRVFDVQPGAEVTLIGIGIRNGRVSEEEYGGGIRNRGALTLLGCRLTENDGGLQGGGLFSEDFSTLFVSRTTFEGNTASLGGGLSSDGESLIIESRIHANVSGSGGGILNGGPMQLVRSTVDANLATLAHPAFGGGGIDTRFDVLVLFDSTLSGNASAGPGGGIYNGVAGEGSSVLLFNSTVASNAGDGGGGLWQSLKGAYTLGNTIVSGNQPEDCGSQLGGGFVSLGHNVASDGTCDLVHPEDGPNLDPKLGPLADNGGPTPTHLPQQGSLVVDTGSNDLCTSMDQRGVPRFQGAACDIGAVEKTAGDQTIQALEDIIDGPGFPVFPQLGLLAKLAVARRLDDGGPGDLRAAQGALRAFLNSVAAHRGVRIPMDEADELTALASALLADSLADDQGPPRRPPRR